MLHVLAISMMNLLADSLSVSKVLDSSLLDLIGDTLGIICNNSNNIKYTNILMTRLSIRALLSKRHGGIGSPYVIIIDAGKQ